MQWTFAEQIVRDSGAAVDLQHVVDDGPAEIEIAEQSVVAGELRLRHREIDGREALAFRGRRAGDQRRVDRLQTLHVIQPRAQRTELLGGSFVGMDDVEQQRFFRRFVRNHFDLIDQAFEGLRFVHRRDGARGVEQR